ncbi:MAG: hypothetical protein OQJ76_09860 [Rhodospirillales bacterium]|nr:hypothetical protein [Rhodospirillales bacterium]
MLHKGRHHGAHHSGGLEAELEAGTLLISNSFDMPGWEPETIHRLDDSFCPEVYVYRVPENPLSGVEG